MIIRFEDMRVGYDIVVVGLGRAGYSFVNSISDKYKVLVIDSRLFPRNKACSGILVEKSKVFFSEDLEKLHLSRPKIIDVEYLDFDNALGGLIKRKGFLNTDRFGFDKFLFEKIKNLPNIDFVQDTRLVEFNLKNNLVVTICETKGVVKSVVSKYLVGCDGANSGIRKKIFRREIDLYVAIQEFIPVSNKFDRAFFILDNSLTDFYCWIIPKDNFVEVGGLFSPQDSSLLFARFKHKIEKRFGISGKGHVEAALVLRPKTLKDVCFGIENVFLCGEAGGFISPRSAEGISYALESGKICAEAINSESKNTLRDYKNMGQQLLLRLGNEMEKAKLFSNVSKRRKLFD